MAIVHHAEGLAFCAIQRQNAHAAFALKCRGRPGDDRCNARIYELSKEGCPVFRDLDCDRAFGVVDCRSAGCGRIVACQLILQEAIDCCRNHRIGGTCQRKLLRPGDSRFVSRTLQGGPFHGESGKINRNSGRSQQSRERASKGQCDIAAPIRPQLLED